MLTVISGLRGEQVISATPEQAAQALARRLSHHLEQRLTEANVVHLALSGGTSGALLCDVLAADKTMVAATWSQIHVWMVDERCVPDYDPRLNFDLVRNRLAIKVGLPSANLHPMPVMLADGAAIYQRRLDVALSEPAHGGRLDAVVLGMGPDGHTASLFPHSPALDDKTSSVVVNDGDCVTLPRPRMTMTYPILNSARLIVMLVTGAAKRPALARLAAGRDDLHALPIAGVMPGQESQMVWYFDRDALPESAAV